MKKSPLNEAFVVRHTTAQQNYGKNTLEFLIYLYLILFVEPQFCYHFLSLQDHNRQT